MRSKPAEWLRNVGVELPLPPALNLPTVPAIVTPSQPPQVQPVLKPTSIQPRSGQAITKTQFASRWLENFNEKTGGTGWAKAQKFSGYFSAVLLLPALRWNQYVTKEQYPDPEEAKRKRLELASRDFFTLFGGNLLYFAVWLTGLSFLELKYPKIPENYLKNIAYLFGDAAKILNAGVFAVVFSKWLTARKEKNRLSQKKEAEYQQQKTTLLSVSKPVAVENRRNIHSQFK